MVSAEDEESQVDQFPAEEVRKWLYFCNQNIRLSPKSVATRQLLPHVEFIRYGIINEQEWTTYSGYLLTSYAFKSMSVKLKLPFWLNVSIKQANK